MMLDKALVPILDPCHVGQRFGNEGWDSFKAREKAGMITVSITMHRRGFNSGLGTREEGLLSHQACRWWWHR